MSKLNDAPYLLVKASRYPSANDAKNLTMRKRKAVKDEKKRLITC